MTQFYADRAYLFFNGIEVANLKSLKVTIDDSVTRVDTMSRDRRSAGWKKGNRKVSGSFEFDVRDDQAQPDLSYLYGQQGVNAVFQMGTKSERFSLIDVVQTTSDYTASVGETGKTINYEARDCVNENGVSVNQIIGF
jgi:hypothetical protein